MEHTKYNVRGKPSQPCLLLMDATARTAICGYRTADDFLDDVTLRQMVACAKEVWANSTWEKNPSLRSQIVGNKKYYYMWGCHHSVVSSIRKMLDDNGYAHVEFTTPQVEGDSLNVYMVGGEYL